MKEGTSLAEARVAAADKSQSSEIAKLSEGKEAGSYEPRALGERENTKIFDHIESGLGPEQINKRLELELQQPEVQRQLVEEFSMYSENITPYIRTMAELNIYNNLGLNEGLVNGRSCLQSEIDPQAKDAMGRTNMERMSAGRAPMDKNGDSTNLNHIGQEKNSPLAELPDRIHREFDAVFHDKSIKTQVHYNGNNWNVERAQYWKERAKQC